MLSCLKPFKRIRTSNLKPIRTTDFLFRWNQNKVNLVVCQYGLYPFAREIVLPTDDLEIERDMFLMPVAHFKKGKKKVSDWIDRESITTFFQIAEKNFQKMTGLGKDFSFNANSLKLDRTIKPSLLAAINDSSYLSFNDLLEFYVEGTEEIIGQFEDLIIDDVDWTIHYILVDTEPGHHKKLVALPFDRLTQVNWIAGVLNIDIPDHLDQEALVFPNEFFSKQDQEMHFKDSIGFP